MKRWKVVPVSDTVPSAFAVRAIAGIGTPSLAGSFLSAMQELLPASHCTVFALEANGRVAAVSTASAHGEVAAVTAVEYYRNRFDLQDSNMVWMARKKAPVRPQTWLSHQYAEDVRDPHYRDVCYTQPGIRERTSVLLLNPDGGRIAVSFYRNLAYKPFDERDFHIITTCAPVLQAAVTAHVRATSEPTAGDTLHHKVLSLLANRERQVVAHLLAGKTSRETAELLGLRLTTVLTYRYRAFAKLGVRTQRELLAALDSLPLNVTGRGAASSRRPS